MPRLRELLVRTMLVASSLAVGGCGSEVRIQLADGAGGSQSEAEGTCPASIPVEDGECCSDRGAVCEYSFPCGKFVIECAATAWDISYEPTAGCSAACPSVLPGFMSSCGSERVGLICSYPDETGACPPALALCDADGVWTGSPTQHHCGLQPPMGCR